jgi:ribosomal protein S18 acetylase RimI-like enzyme
MKGGTMRLPQDYEIVPVTEEDIREVAALTAASWKSAYRGIIDGTYLDALGEGQRWIDILPARLKDPKRHAVALKRNDVAIGTSWYGLSTTEGYPDDGEITALYLLPEHIGSGYGHPLMEYTLGSLAELGYTYAVLDVFTANERALRFYHSFGFKIIQCDMPMEIGDRAYPAHIMRRKL